MRMALVVAALFTLLAATAVDAAPPGEGGTFPGQGNGVGGTPGANGTPGTFPGGGATNGVFPGGANATDVSAAEPLALFLTGIGLLGASLLRRKR
jgi:hypothetical protein